jgi:hypothetical protein
MSFFAGEIAAWQGTFFRKLQELAQDPDTRRRMSVSPISIRIRAIYHGAGPAHLLALYWVNCKYAYSP